MTRLRQCSTEVIGRIKKMFTCLIKEAFRYHFDGDRLLNYRLDNNGALPTRMKSFYSWNLSSWVSTATQDYRLRRCKRLLRSGPICMQETKWKGPETEALYQSLPGVQIVHTPAVAFNERTCTEGWRFSSHLAGRC